MIRRKLLIATAIIASVVLTACSDMTGPKNDCPIITGSSTCMH
jgi:predicted small secreted protein